MFLFFCHFLDLSNPEISAFQLIFYLETQGLHNSILKKTRKQLGGLGPWVGINRSRVPGTPEGSSCCHIWELYLGEMPTFGFISAASILTESDKDIV